MKQYDVAVIGLGAMGSASLFQLSKLGLNVIGIDQFSPPHKLGSTHGDTRITRQAIGEGSEYVPLVLRSNEIWRELEELSGRELLVQNGGLIMASYTRGSTHHGSNEFLQTTIEAAEKYNIEHETLSNEQITEKFPQFKLVGDEDGYYEPGAGFLRPEACIEVQLEQAKLDGAEILTNAEVSSINPSEGGVEISVGQEKIHAKKVIVTAGSWVNEFLPERQAKNFKVYRQVLYWFDIAKNYENLIPEKMPIYIWEFGGGHDDFLYGFPAIDGENGGLKIASEQYTEVTNPDEVNREVTDQEKRDMYDKYVKDRFPDLSPDCLRAVSCLYTVTPDYNFVIDFHPEDANIIVASPCSGHGFKHSAAIGESLAQMATKGSSDIDVSSFSFKRFN